MTFFAILVGIPLFLFCLLLLFLRQKNVTKIDGYTIKFHGMREDAYLEYIEPSGRTLTFDAYWRSPQKDRTVVLDVAFPAELAVPENDEPRKHEAIERLGIPKTPSVQTQIPSTRRDEIKDRVSRGLKKLKIAHAFVSPQRFGWTSFEDGKEIYHG